MNKKNKLFGKKDIILLFLISVALMTPIFTKDTVTIFITSIIGIIPLAYYIGLGTEELAAHYSSVAGGLISSTFGNLTELIIGILAVKEGLTEVIKASLTGAIIGNTLFVFGSAVFLGGFKYKEQKLSSSLTDINGTLLLITMLLFLFPSLLPLFHEKQFALDISLMIAVLMIIIYIASLIFSLITHKEWFVDTADREKPTLSKGKSVMILATASVILAFISESFVGVLENFSHTYHLGELFIGVVIIGLVGNVAEHLFAINLALKNKVDLLITASIGSALQIALLVTPILLFTAYIFGQNMTLLFTPLEIASIIASVLLISEISNDRIVNWFEGLLLIALYFVLAVLFYYAG